MTAWDKMDQRNIDKAVRQWLTCLHACIKAEDGHFEHTFANGTVLTTRHMC